MHKVKLNLAIIGYGKMGKTIHRIAEKKGHTVSVIIRSTNTGDMQNLPPGIDAAIEFSKPESAVANLEILARKGIPTVCGTTGWDRYREQVRTLYTDLQTGFVYASNFSIGMNIFFHINKKLAMIMNTQPDFSVEIRETHHTEKLDAPSGTAITIAEDIVKRIERKDNWVNQPSGKENEIPIISHRVANVKGEHSVSYTSDLDKLVFTHQARSREGFAEGAIIAAEFIAQRKGVFSFEDILGL